jgi:hypothetical protein
VTFDHSVEELFAPREGFFPCDFTELVTFPEQRLSEAIRVLMEVCDRGSFGTYVALGPDVVTERAYQLDAVVVPDMELEPAHALTQRTGA